jgi:mxaJ protein
VYGDYREPNPPVRVLDAVVRGDLDLAIVWGPVAGFFAHAHPGTLVTVPVGPDPDPRTGLGFSFSIGLGVRKGDPALAGELEAFIARHRPEIERILDDHGVIRTAEAGQ